MARFSTISLERGVWKIAATIPRVFISMSPSHITSEGDQVVAVFITVTGTPAGTVDIAQSGNLDDDDFSQTLIEDIEDAVALAAGITFDGTNTFTFAADFVGLSFTHTIDSDPAPGLDWILTLSNATGGLAIGQATAQFTTVLEQEPPPAPEGDILAGVNFGSGSFGTTTDPILGQTYFYPTADQIEFFHNRGARITRVAMRWPRLQPTINGDLSAPDLALLDAIAGKINTLDDHILLLNLHEFIGRRVEEGGSQRKIGHAELPVSTFIDFWTKVATHFAAMGAKFRIGLFNEPQSPGGSQSWEATEWRDVALETIEGLRLAGITSVIHVPGVSWTGGHSWVSSGNLAAWDDLTPEQKALLADCIFEVHNYVDDETSASGAHSGTGDVPILGAGSTDLIDFTVWCRANGYRSFLGEFGVPYNEAMIEENRDLLDYMYANSDVWDGWTVWGADLNDRHLVGPVNGSYSFPAENPRLMELLLDYMLPIESFVTPTDISLSANTSSQGMPQGTRVGFVTAIGGTPGDFYVWSLTDSAGGKYQMDGNMIEVGSVARTAGETNPVTVQGIGRGGVAFTRQFFLPVFADPVVNLTAIAPTTIDEGDDLTFRLNFSAVVTGAGFDIWCGGGDPAEMAETFDAAVRPVLEAAGCSVVSQSSTKKRIRMGSSTPVGNHNIPWTSLADHLTEGSSSQIDIFIDNPVGVTFPGGAALDVVSFFILDTSQTPGWNITVGPASAFPGQPITHNIFLSNATIGAKVIIGYSAASEADDDDFTTTLDAALTAAVAATSGWAYNAGTNELEVTGATDGNLPFERVVDTDEDGDETYELELTSPTASVINTATASALIREEPGEVQILSEDYTAGQMEETTFLGCNAARWQELADGTWEEVAVDAPRLGDKGLVLEGPWTNLLSNPRGPWSNSGWTSVGTGVEDGLPYVDMQRVLTVESFIDNFFSFEPGLVPGGPNIRYLWRFGIKVVSNTAPGTKSVQMSLRGRNSSGGSAQEGLQSTRRAIGPNRVWLEHQFQFTTSTVARINPTLVFNGFGGPGTIVVRFYCPQLIAGENTNLPFVPPDGVIGQALKPAEEVSIAAEPFDEGTFLLNFDATGRDRDSGAGGQCYLSIFNSVDPDNHYIEVRQGAHGALRYIVVANGATVADINGGYVVHGKTRKFEQKLAIAYGLFDARLVFDGQLIGSTSIATVPSGLDTIRLGRDRNGLNHASMRARNWTHRNDQRATELLQNDTLKPGVEFSPGVNEAGAEFGEPRPSDNPTFMPVHNTDYFFPEVSETTKSSGFAYLADRGLGHIRLPIQWEQIQPTLNDALDTAELARIETVVDGCETHGIRCIIDLHNFANYRIHNVVGGNKIGSEAVPASAFADFWSRIATVFVGHAGLLGYGLMNEPTGMDDEVYLACCQAATDAIRLVDEDGYIFINGRPAAPAHGWPDYNMDLHIIDPRDGESRVIYEAHAYFDSNKSGAYNPSGYGSQGGTPERASLNIEPFISWLEANGYTSGRRWSGYIGETNAPNNNSSWELLMDNAYKFMHEHGLLVAPWAKGRAWGSYVLTLEPSGGIGAKTDRSQMNIIEKHVSNFDFPPPPSSGGLSDLGKIRSGSSYPANAWAMSYPQDGRIYVGTGNSSNSEPNINAGSGDLRYIDLTDDALKTSTYLAAAINDEQIDKFHLFDSNLVFPGIDPRSGNIHFHREIDGVWGKHQVATTFSGTGTTIPHLFDIRKFGDEWFGSLGTHTGLWDLFRHSTAADGVGSWAVCQNSGINLGTTRAGELFELDDELYGNLLTSSNDFLAVWNGTSFVKSGILRASVFPDLSWSFVPSIVRPILIGSDLIYIAAHSWNDSHWNPLGLFAAGAAFAGAARVTLPTDETPWDLKVDGSTALVLTSKKVSASLYENRLRSSVSPFTTWDEEVMFEYGTFARSFSFNGTDYYFGMGTDITNAQAVAQGFAGSYTETIKSESGTILKWN